MSGAVVLDKGWCLYTHPDGSLEVRKRGHGGWHTIKKARDPNELQKFVTTHHPDLAPRLRHAIATIREDFQN